MKIKEFISKLEEQFDDLPKGKMQPESNFREIFEWNSINALIVIALVQTDYGVMIDAEDFRKAQTVNDIYSIIEQRREE